MRVQVLVALLTASPLLARADTGLLVLPEGAVPPPLFQSVSKALADGLSAGGSVLLPASRTESLRSQLSAGGCDADCEQSLRRVLAPAGLVVAHLQVSGGSFALSASSGGAVHAASGPVERMEYAARRIGHRMAGGPGSLALEGGPEEAVWKVDGARVEPDPEGRLRLPAGEHLLRLENGGRPVAIQEVRIEPGELALAEFPGEGGWRRKLGPGHAGEPGHPLSPSAPTDLLPRVEAVFAHRSRTLSGGGPDSFDFYGAGLRASVEAERAGLTGLASLEVLSYEMTIAEVPLGGGSMASVNGGDSVDGRVEGGWRFNLRQGGEGSPSLTALGGLYAESHAAQDFQGRVSGVLTSYQRLALRLEALGRLPLSDPLLHRPLTLEADLGVEPLSTFQESPAGASGSNPSPGVGYGLTLGALWSPVAFPWSVALSVGEERRTVQFSGPGPAAVLPRPMNGILSERVDRLALAVSRSF